MTESPSETAAYGRAYIKACGLVGQFMNSWAYLESAMNSGIAKILGMDQLEGIIATVNMQARAKIHIIKTLINLRGQHEEWRDGALKTMGKISEMADHRNVVAHTAFGPHESGGVEFFSIRASGKLKIPDVVWPDNQFHEYCSEMRSLCGEVKSITEKLHKHKTLLELADALAKQKPAPQGALNALFPAGASEEGLFRGIAPVMDKPGRAAVEGEPKAARISSEDEG